MFKFNSKILVSTILITASLVGVVLVSGNSQSPAKVSQAEILSNGEYFNPTTDCDLVITSINKSDYSTELVQRCKANYPDPVPVDSEKKTVTKPLAPKKKTQYIDCKANFNLDNNQDKYEVCLASKGIITKSPTKPTTPKPSTPKKPKTINWGDPIPKDTKTKVATTPTKLSKAYNLSTELKKKFDALELQDSEDIYYTITGTDSAKIIARLPNNYPTYTSFSGLSRLNSAVKSIGESNVVQNGKPLGKNVYRITKADFIDLFNRTYKTVQKVL